MAIAGTLDWQSTIAEGAARDASAVAALRASLAGLQTATGGAGRASDVLALQLQREGGAAASVAARNKAVADLISAQAAGEQKIREIQAKGVADRLAIDAKSEQQRLTQAQRTADRLLASERRAQDQQTKAVQQGSAQRLQAERETRNQDQKESEEAKQKSADRILAVAAAVGQAAKWTVMQTADLLLAGEQIAIRETSIRETAVIQLEALLGSQAQAEDTYTKVIDLANDVGLERADAIAKMNRLITAGFGAEGAMRALRSIGDATAVLGEQAGSRLAGVLIKIESAGKLTTRDITALKGLVPVADLYEQLAKSMGKTVVEVQALAKAGKISADVAQAAIEDVVEKRIGGLGVKLGETFPRILGDVKDEILKLFDRIDLSPAKEAFKDIFDMFKGPEGEVLKTSITDLFNTLNEVIFAPFRGPEGRDTLKQMFLAGATAANALATILTTLAPLITGIVSGIKEVAGFIGLTGTIGERVRRPGFAGVGGSVEGGAVRPLPALSTAAPPEAGLLGKNIAAGVEGGIREGQPGVVAAIVGLVASGLIGGQKKAEVASPAGLFKRELGYPMGAGVAVGMDSAQGLIAASSRAMVTGAQRAGAGALGAAGMGGGGGMQFNFGAGAIVIHASTRAGGARAADGFYDRCRAIAEGGL